MKKTSGNDLQKIREPSGGRVAGFVGGSCRLEPFIFPPQPNHLPSLFSSIFVTYLLTGASYWDFFNILDTFTSSFLGQLYHCIILVLTIYTRSYNRRQTVEKVLVSQVSSTFYINADFFTERIKGQFLDVCACKCFDVYVMTRFDNECQ